MLERIEGLPDGVVGIRARGKVTETDYLDVLVPAVEDALSRHRRLRLLYVLGDEFDGYTGAAAWEDAKIGMRHFTAFERVAVVSDHEWVVRMVKAFGILLPGDVRVYVNDEEHDAREWVSAPSSPGELEFELHEDDSVLVLEPHDELEVGDFERLERVVDPFIERTGGLSGLVVVAEDFPGWDDLAAFLSHLRFVRDHRKYLRRVALVTGSRFLSAMPKFARLLIDAEVRHFDFDDRDAAMEWVRGR